MNIKRFFAILLVLAAAKDLSACSAKITSGDAPPTDPQQSPQSQSLSVTPESQAGSAKANEVSFERPAGTLDFYFLYKPTKTETVYVGYESPFSLNCDFDKGAVEYSWQEMNAEQVVKEHAWSKPMENSFTLYSGTAYRLHTRFSNFQGCGALVYQFSIISASTADSLVSSDSLYVDEEEQFYISRSVDVSTHDFTIYQQTGDQYLYFKSLADLDASGCHSNFKREIEWRTYDSHGDFIESKPVDKLSLLRLRNGTKSVLRFRYHYSDTCDSARVQKFQLGYRM
ncbi:MAG: hypothetical protein KDD22_00775 [Bdellovibrionales bacterium]|nr:hypothetical protein [Bdellovibrionales bacterium]